MSDTSKPSKDSSIAASSSNSDANDVTKGLSSRSALSSQALSQTSKRRREQTNSQTGPKLRPHAEGNYVFPTKHRTSRKQQPQAVEAQNDNRSDEEDAIDEKIIRSQNGTMSQTPTNNNDTNNKAKKESEQEQTWNLGDTKYTRSAIKEFFQDKQIFNQANIFTRKTDDDLFEDSDEEVQEEGLVTQIHKRNMQDVYDMTPLDKKFTFLWNEFFIAQEQRRIKQKIPIKRNDIYTILQQFIDNHTIELSQLYNQFVIHLFTLQDNGIIDSSQVANSLKYLKQILDTKQQ